MHLASTRIQAPVPLIIVLSSDLSTCFSNGNKLVVQGMGKQIFEVKKTLHYLPWHIFGCIVCTHTYTKTHYVSGQFGLIKISFCINSCFSLIVQPCDHSTVPNRSMVGMPLCLNAPVAMPILPSRNGPIAKSQCSNSKGAMHPHFGTQWSQCSSFGRNAPLS